MQVLVTRVPNGFTPADDEAREDIKRFPVGSVARLDFKLMRNYAFHKKYFALVDLGFQYFAEACPQQEYKGKQVKPSLERFRKEMAILAGFFTPVWSIKGELRVEADSISFAKMSQDRFEQLYDATIRVLLDKVFNGDRVAKWTEAELRSVVTQIEEFQ